MQTEETASNGARRCGRCLLNKTTEDFFVYDYYICKTCRRMRSRLDFRKRYAAHRDEILADRKRRNKAKKAAAKRAEKQQ